MVDVTIKEEIDDEITIVEEKPSISVLKPEIINSALFDHLTNDNIDETKPIYPKQIIFMHAEQLVCLICTKNLDDPTTFVRFKSEEPCQRHFASVHRRQIDLNEIRRQLKRQKNINTAYARRMVNPIEFVDCSNLNEEESMKRTPTVKASSPTKTIDKDKFILKCPICTVMGFKNNDLLRKHIDGHKNNLKTKSLVNELEENKILSGKVFCCPLCIIKNNKIIDNEVSTKLETITAIKNHLNFVHFNNFSFDDVKEFLRHNSNYLRDKDSCSLPKFIRRIEPPFLVGESKIKYDRKYTRKSRLVIERNLFQDKLINNPNKNESNQNRKWNFVNVDPQNINKDVKTEIEKVNGIKTIKNNPVPAVNFNSNPCFVNLGPVAQNINLGPQSIQLNGGNLNLASENINLEPQAVNLGTSLQNINISPQNVNLVPTNYILSPQGVLLGQQNVILEKQNNIQYIQLEQPNVQPIIIESEQEKRLQEIQEKLNELQKERDKLLQNNTVFMDVPTIITQNVVPVITNPHPQLYEMPNFQFNSVFLPMPPTEQSTENEDEKLGNDELDTPDILAIDPDIIETGSETLVPIGKARKKSKRKENETKYNVEEVIDLTEDAPKKVIKIIKFPPKRARSSQ